MGLRLSHQPHAAAHQDRKALADRCASDLQQEEGTEGTCPFASSWDTGREYSIAECVVPYTLHPSPIQGSHGSRGSVAVRQVFTCLGSEREKKCEAVAWWTAQGERGAVSAAGATGCHAKTNLSLLEGLDKVPTTDRKAERLALEERNETVFRGQAISGGSALLEGAGGVI